jgi:electron transport complex protein RnfG
MSDITTAGGGLPNLRRHAGYPSLLLGTFTLLAATLLVVADRFTREPIAERGAEDLKASLAQVIPLALQDNDPVADAMSIPSATGVPVRVYRAMRQGRVYRCRLPGHRVGVRGPDRADPGP